MQSNPNQPAPTGGESKAGWESKPAVNIWNKKYDPDKFYIRATNDKGFGYKLDLRLPPEIMGRLGNLVDKMYPDYHNAADVARDLIAHGLVIREEESGNLEVLKFAKPLRERLEAMRRADILIARTEFFKNYETKMDTAMTGLVNVNDWSSMRQGLIEMSEFASGQPQPYRGKILEQVKKWATRVPAEEIDDEHGNGEVGTGSLWSG